MFLSIESKISIKLKGHNNLIHNSQLKKVIFQALTVPLFRLWNEHEKKLLWPLQRGALLVPEIKLSVIDYCVKDYCVHFFNNKYIFVNGCSFLLVKFQINSLMCVRMKLLHVFAEVFKIGIWSQMPDWLISWRWEVFHRFISGWGFSVSGCFWNKRPIYICKKLCF